MRKAQNTAQQGELGFAAVRSESAPYVKSHRMTVGVPDRTPFLEGKFGVCDVGGGQTVHRAVIEPSVEFETAFTAQAGLVITVVLEGVLEFSLDGTAHRFEVDNAPIALAWTNLSEVEVTRKGRKGEGITKCQLRSPLNFFDDVWHGKSGGFLDRHAQLTAWTPGMALTDAAQRLLADDSQSELRARMASARMAVEALDSLLTHLEIDLRTRGGSRLATTHGYVEQTAAERPTLADIARQNGFSVSALQRAYRATYGMTVIEHQRAVLLERAYDALLEGRATILQAARDAGYANPTNFTAAFTRKFGVVPSQLGQKM